MKIGVFINQSRILANDIVDFVQEVEDSNLDGIFIFDHLWPVGQPTKAAHDSVSLASFVLSNTSQLKVGILAMRLTLRGLESSLSSILSLSSLAEERLIVTLGIGDKLSDRENSAFGIEKLSFEQRLIELEKAVELLKTRISELWIGGSSSAINDIALKYNLLVNFWDVPICQIDGSTTPFTYAAPFVSVSHSKDLNAVEDFRNLANAGAKWAIVGWPPSIELLGYIKDNL